MKAVVLPVSVVGFRNVNKFKNKKIIVGFPPKRHNLSVAKASRGNFIIGRKRIKDSRLPVEVVKPNGFKLQKPKEWE